MIFFLTTYFFIHKRSGKVCGEKRYLRNVEDRSCFSFFSGKPSKDFKNTDRRIRILYTNIPSKKQIHSREERRLL